jgi:hypothetical protein
MELFSRPISKQLRAVTLSLPETRYDDMLDVDLLSSWVVESFRALAPKSVVKQLDQNNDL